MCPHNKAFHHFGGQYQVHDPYIRIHLYTSISHFMNDLCPVAFTICEFLTMTKFSLQFECVVINFQSHILKDPIFHAPKRILSCFPLHDQMCTRKLVLTWKAFEFSAGENNIAWGGGATHHLWYFQGLVGAGGARQVFEQPYNPIPIPNQALGTITALKGWQLPDHLGWDSPSPAWNLEFVHLQGRLFGIRRSVGRTIDISQELDFRAPWACL